MEKDLNRSDVIIQKVQNDHVYAQNLYAALCNTSWIKEESETPWSCSWRYAGALVARLRGEGDYMDWYCSSTFREEVGFVMEGVLVHEVVEDLANIGWHCELNKNEP